MQKMFKIPDLSSISPEEYQFRVRKLAERPSATDKFIRNYVAHALKNKKSADLIRIGCQEILNMDACPPWLVKAHLSLLARRRNDLFAADFCSVLEASGQYEDSDVAASLESLRIQSKIRLGMLKEAEEEVRSLQNRSDTTSAAQNTLISWRYSYLGQLSESYRAFLGSNAKHVQTIDLPDPVIKPIKLMAPDPDALKVYLTTNNEMEYMPALLEYYRGLGTVQFVVIDNDSRDGTLEFLKEQDDVVLFWTADSFNESTFGCSWLNYIFEATSSADEICLRIDADEFIAYPDMDTRSINEFTKQANSDKYDLVYGILIDMFPKDLGYEGFGPDDGFDRVMQEAIYFDKTIETRGDIAPPYIHHSGGVRQRVFENSRTYLTKTPFFRGGGLVKYLNANHTTSPGRVAPYNCCLLHYKITPKSTERYLLQMKRKEHYQGGARYRKYLDLIESGSDIRSDETVRYEGAATLEELGLLVRRGSSTDTVGD